MRFLRFLNEKLIVHKSTASKNYGNIILLAGGAGSGKGFATDNFLDSGLYKRRDIDEVKKLFIKLQQLKKKWPEIDNLDLTNPDHVGRLHLFIKKKGIKDKTLNLLTKGVKHGRLPNILFDITFASLDRAPLKELQRMVTELGYDPKNINLVWVLAKYELAVVQNHNPERGRIVPADILLDTHEGAAINMEKVFKSEVPFFNNKKYFDGAIHVILNNKENTIVWKDKDGKEIETKPPKPGDVGYSKLIDPETGKRTKERKPEPVIKSFKYLVVKEQGKSITSDKEIKKQLYDWIIKNIPATAQTASI
jgi:hypothetical protein